MHFHSKETGYLVERGKAPGRFFVLIPVQVDVGYPAFVKGSHDLSRLRVSPVEVAVEVGSVVVWCGGVELVYPAVGSFQRGGGFAVMLGY